MIFTCPSGHKTFLGEPTGLRALPIIGAGELRHCLTCNAERRFEWKPEPLKYPEIDLPIEEVIVSSPAQALAEMGMPTVTVSREELAKRYPEGEPE